MKSSNQEMPLAYPVSGATPNALESILDRINEFDDWIYAEYRFLFVTQKVLTAVGVSISLLCIYLTVIFTTVLAYALFVDHSVMYTMGENGQMNLTWFTKAIDPIGRLIMNNGVSGITTWLLFLLPGSIFAISELAFAIQKAKAKNIQD